MANNTTTSMDADTVSLDLKQIAADLQGSRDRHVLYCPNQEGRPLGNAVLRGLGVGGTYSGCPSTECWGVAVAGGR